MALEKPHNFMDVQPRFGLTTISTRAGTVLYAAGIETKPLDTSPAPQVYHGSVLCWFLAKISLDLGHPLVIALGIAISCVPSTCRSCAGRAK